MKKRNTPQTYLSSPSTTFGNPTLPTPHALVISSLCHFFHTRVCYICTYGQCVSVYVALGILLMISSVYYCTTFFCNSTLSFEIYPVCVGVYIYIYI